MGTTLNVALITTFRQRCGIASYSENLAKALAKENVNVYIIRIPRFGPKDAGVFQNLIDNIPLDKIIYPQPVCVDEATIAVGTRMRTIRHLTPFSPVIIS